MDVSAIAPGAGTPAPAASDQTGSSQPPQAQAVLGQTPLPSAQPTPSNGPGNPHAQSSGIAPAVAKLFGSGSSPQPVALNVSYKVIGPLNEIVTVFSDPKTGKEIAQFPPDLLIGLAEFFDQKDGVTLDKTA